MNEETQVAAEAGKVIRTLEGRVISDRMDKTATVLVERRIKHPLYKKYIRRKTKLHAHDENNDARTGDTVRIAETRPLSKLKRWKLVEVLQRGE